MTNEAGVTAVQAVRRKLRSGRRWTGGDAIRLMIAIVVLSVGWLLARGSVPGWERRLFEDINGASSAWYGLVWPIMQLGNIVVAISVGLIVGVLLRSVRVASVAALTPLAAWYVAVPMKHLVDRVRPTDLGLQVVNHGHMVQAHGLGFPSGHSTVAWALATMLAPHLIPSLRPVAYVLAAIVCVARVYVGAHMPLDVVGGAGLGILIGEIGRWVEVLVRRAEPAELSSTDPASA